MKKLTYLLFSLLFVFVACDDEITENQETGTFNVSIQLIYPEGYEADANVNITFTNTTNGSGYEAKTNADGIATFKVEAGVYRATATEKRINEATNKYIALNGASENITLDANWDESKMITITLSESTVSQIVIKEMYVGGCQKGDGSGYFYYDKYITLYNNSPEDYSLKNVCFGMVLPYGADSSMNTEDLSYEKEGWIPAGLGIWTFSNEVILKPYSQIVVATLNAVDNTQTHPLSINFANSDYYCMYDIEVYSHAASYPSPSELIPTSHYLKAYHYGSGTAWSLSNTNPGLFIFKPTDGTTPEDFANDATNLYNIGGQASQLCKKVPLEWVIDGVETFLTSKLSSCKKRVPTIVDLGYVEHTYQEGYSVYRNVDKEATLVIEGNEQKLVYNYAYGTESIDEGGSTDPSGIDAEASIKNGAIIIYQDSNNSSLDFHLRSQASLRD